MLTQEMQMYISLVAVIVGPCVQLVIAKWQINSLSRQKWAGNNYGFEYRVRSARKR